MHIITLSGVDGSGKSTQLEHLRSQLQTEGKKVAYFHAVSFSLPETLRKKLLGSRQAGTAKAQTTSGSVGITLRKIILWIDLLRFRHWIAHLEKTGVDILLSDRYFYDTLINIAYLEKATLDASYLSWLTKHVIRPNQAFYLRVTPEQVMERGHAPEQGLQYLKDKTTLFETATSLFGFTVIDANQARESVTQSIQAAL